MGKNQKDASYFCYHQKDTLVQKISKGCPSYFSISKYICVNTILATLIKFATTCTKYFENFSQNCFNIGQNYSNIDKNCSNFVKLVQLVKIDLVLLEL